MLRWLGKISINVFLKNIDPTRKAKFENLNLGRQEAKPTRFLRSSAVTPRPEGDGEDANKPYDSSFPVDILEKLPKDFYEKVTATTMS